MIKTLRYLIIGLSFIGIGATQVMAQKIHNNWLREWDDGWVMYSYQASGDLYRATSEQPHLESFGEYTIDNDRINFIDNPDNYTAVVFDFSVENGADILHLYDAESRKPYGDYHSVSDIEMNNLMHD